MKLRTSEKAAAETLPQPAGEILVKHNLNMLSEIGIRNLRAKRAAEQRGQTPNGPKD